MSVTRVPKTQVARSKGSSRSLLDWLVKVAVTAKRETVARCSSRYSPSSFRLAWKSILAGEYEGDPLACQSLLPLVMLNRPMRMIFASRQDNLSDVVTSFAIDMRASEKSSNFVLPRGSLREIPGPRVTCEVWSGLCSRLASQRAPRLRPVARTKVASRTAVRSGVEPDGFSSS